MKAYQHPLFDLNQTETLKKRAVVPTSPKNDRIYTPVWLARDIIDRLPIQGSALEPCYGGGAIYDQLILLPAVTRVTFCELDMGKDFFNHTDPVDWIVTNPPFSLYRQFLIHSMRLAENVVFLGLGNALWMKARLRAVTAAGFGVREIRQVATPTIAEGWPQFGIALTATWFQRDYAGPAVIDI